MNILKIWEFLSRLSMYITGLAGFLLICAIGEIIRHNGIAQSAKIIREGSSLYHNYKVVFWVLGIGAIIFSIPEYSFLKLVGYDIPLDNRDTGTYFYYGEVSDYFLEEYIGTIPIIIDVEAHEDDNGRITERKYWVTDIAFQDGIVSVEPISKDDAEKQFVVVDPSTVAMYEIRLLDQTATIPGREEKTYDSWILTLLVAVINFGTLIIYEKADAITSKE